MQTNFGDRSLNRLFVFFGGLLVIVLVTALVAPRFIDWDNYRADFEEQAGKVLGQKVEVLGEAKARLLPLPRIIFTNVRVGARKDGKPMMVVDRFRVDAELAPLLKGEVVIVDMELQSPKINIAIGENGVVDWTDRKTGLVNPEDVLLEKVTISNGSIRLHNIATNQAFEAEQINAVISARSLAGPWRVLGDLVLQGEKADIKISTGRLQQKGTINTRLNIQPHNHPYNIELDGPVGMVDGALNYKGKFKLKAALPKKAMVEGRPAPSYPYASLPIRVDGRFDARPDALKVPEFTLKVGKKEDPYSITGTAQAAFGDRSLFKVVAEGQQIDVDRLGKLLPKNGNMPSLAERLEVLKKIVEKVPVPPAEGRISLYLPAIIAGDTVIREVGVDILPMKNGWKLSNLEAGLPGRTTLQANGLLSLGDQFGFNGLLLLASKQPSGFAGWLKKDVDEAIRRLPNAGFQAKVMLNEKRVVLQDLEIVLGATRLKGALERVQNSNARPALTTVLDGNNIDFETLRALFLLFVSGKDGTRFSDHDMDIKLKGDSFSAFGFKAKAVTASLKLADSRLVIEQLAIGDLAGAAISVKGAINDALNLPDGDLKISLSADKADGVLKLLSKVIGQNPLLDNLRGEPSLARDLKLEATIKAVASGETSKLHLGLVGEAGGTGIDVDFKINGKIDNLDMAEGILELSLVNAQPHILLRQLAVPVLPLEVDGDLRVSGHYKGVPGERGDVAFEASLATAKFSGKGELVRVKGGGIRSRFDLVLQTPDIDPVLLLSGYSFPGVEGGAAVDLSASVTALGPIVTLKNVEGKFGGQKINAKLTLDRNAKPRPKVTGSLALDSISLEFIAGLAMGDSSIEEGVSWSNSPFTTPSLNGIDGTIELRTKVIDLATGGFGYAQPAKNLTASLVINDGDVALRGARADWLGGEIAGDLSFVRNQKESVISSQLVLKNTTLGDVVWKMTKAPVIDGRFGLVINTEGSGATIAEIVSSLSGGGTIVINGGKMQQLNPFALEEILKQADALPDEKLEASAAHLANKELVRKPFEFATAEAAFSIAGGVLRIGSMAVATAEARVTGGLRLDLANLSIDGNARLSFEAGEEALSGATPEIDLVFKGPLTNVKVKRDSSLLASFLTMRARERKERAYEAQKEEILENQRLTRMVRLYKSRARMREKARQERENQEKQDEQVRAEQEKLLKELEATEEKARKARLAIQKKQRETDEKRRQDELLNKQKQLEEAKELERQKADLIRRQKAFDKLLRQQNATKKRKKQKQARKKLPRLAPPKEVRPTGSIKDLPGVKLPGVFDNVEDKIGAILKQN